MKFLKSVPQSVWKSITWRVIASAITGLIVFTALAGEGIQMNAALALGGTAGLIDGVAKIVLYVIHDEIWNRVSQ
jgi:uncharacterized membrane protein